MTRNLLLVMVVATISLSAKHLHLERYYQQSFCAKVHGQLEYGLDDGTRVDCQTSTYSFEVDFGRHAFESVGQALYYAMKTGKRPGIVLIQETRTDNRYIGRIKPLAKRYGIYLFVINPKLEIRAIK
jgi:hypothetical protein